MKNNFLIIFLIIIAFIYIRCVIYLYRDSIGNVFAIKIINGPDFDFPLYYYSGHEYVFPEAELPKGYQSTAIIEIQFYNKGKKLTPRNVFCSIDGVENKAAAWNRPPNAINGLAWGDFEVDGATNWEKIPVIGGLKYTTSNGLVKLTDVVGERIIRLKIETTVAGRSYSETTFVSFGKGPLSVYNQPPSAQKMIWAKADCLETPTVESDPPVSIFTELRNPEDFPAAEYCGGTVHVGPSDITVNGSLPNYKIDFAKGIKLGHWSNIDQGSIGYYAITSRLPTVSQLLAVSRYDTEHNPTVKRKGAALAAGWPGDDYWSGELFCYQDGKFVGKYVCLSNGNDKKESELSLSCRRVVT
jgi:hypothetical protein